ncbi:MAG: tripartite tricarboxylate transporter substrate binding protein, partial [Cyanobacteria bacterium K_DeepCast_35m_m2_023]|nr:tripartite tricarboxylate transporter substrate binding protein [Cyanobacteria bacterium K_DeepCast_35m_m2_023]
MGVLLVASLAHAQQYPTRPIRFIAPYVPGGGVDFVSRVIATKLSETIGQQVIVENRPGAGTNIGSELVARAAPDGYTILVGGVPNVVNPFLFKKLPYDVIKDFAPVTQTTTAPNILAVHPSLPVRSVKELIALAKARKGELTFASAGIGSSNHLSGELFRVMAGVDVVHVPYKGGGAAVVDLIAGQVTMYFGTTPSTVPHVRTGRLRALGVTTLKRSRATPDIPTLDEAGLAGFDNAAWHGLFAPAATPPAVVNRLSSEVVKVLRLPETIERMGAQGVDVIASTPEALAAYVKQDLVRYEKLIRAAGIK